MSKTLVIAEKPSVAQDIVRALTPVAGKFDKHDEHFENEQYVVTSAVGHLVEIQAPAEFDAPSVGELAAERVNLSACVGRFLAAAEATPERIGVSPLFGPMPLSYWRRIHGKHIAHHLRQFGL